MQVQRSSSNQVEFPQTPVQLNPQNLQYHSTLSRAQEGNSKENELPFFPWIFQKIGDFFRWLFCCSPRDTFSKTLLKKLKDKSELIEYKLNNWHEVTVKIKRNGSIAWLLDESWNARGDMHYYEKKPLLKHIINDLDAKTLFVKVDKSSRAHSLTELGFVISKEHPPTPDVKQISYLDFSSKLLFNNGYITTDFIKQIATCVNRCSRKDLDTINLVGRVVTNLTGDTNLDIDDPQAIQKAWNQGRKKGLKNYKIDLYHLLDLHSKFNVFLYETRSNDLWPRVMECDLTRKNSQ